MYDFSECRDGKISYHQVRWLAVDISMSPDRGTGFWTTTCVKTEIKPTELI